MLFALSLLVAAPSELTYDWLVKEHVAGALKRSETDGKVSVEMSYRDNGRGPTQSESYSVDKAGLITAYTVTGTNTFGSKIDESLTGAKYKTNIDEGALKADEFYAPLSGTPEVIAQLARALLLKKAPLALSPSGTASLQKVRTETVDGKKITLYAITGLDLTPIYVWLTDGDNQMFAMLNPGPFGPIRAGFAKHAKKLADLGKAADDQLLLALQKKTRHRTDKPIAFTNVSVFDSKTATVQKDKTVYLFRGRIAAIVPASKPVGKDAMVIDGIGKTLMPSLIDVHGHESKWSAPLQIAGGVGIVRDIGNDNDEFLELIAHVENGDYVGPRYLGRAGFLEGESEFAARGSGIAKSVQEAKNWVDWYAQHGYRQLKIYNSFKPEWVEETVKYAHERGLRVSGHIPAFTNATAMAKAGYDEIQHINQLTLNFLTTPKDDTRTLLRFQLVGDKAASLNLDGPEVKAFIQLLKDKGVAIDPTLACFEGMFRQQMGDPSPQYGMIADHFPANWARGLRQADMDATPEKRAVYRASYKKMIEFAAKMASSGITMMPGTDGLAGFLLHRELELWVEAGLKPARVLQMATWETARELGFDGFGAVVPGAPADVILVEGDPTQNISAIRKVSFISKGEDYYLPSEIHVALGIKPFL